MPPRRDLTLAYTIRRVQPAGVSVTPAVGTPTTTATSTGTGGASHPNEPLGARTRILEHTFSGFPLNSTQLAGTFSTGADTDADASIVTVAGDSAMRVRYPVGLTAGIAPITVRMWDEAGFSGSGARYSDVYLHFRLGTETPDFEIQKDGVKLFYVGYGDSPTVGSDNDGFLLFKGNGTAAAIKPAAHLTAFISKASEAESAGSLRYEQNATTGDPFPFGQVNDLEVRFKVGTPNTADGELWVWINGVLTHRYDPATGTGVQYLSATNTFTRGIYTMQITPVWGGTGGTKSRTDYLDYHYLYASGA